MAHWSLQDVLAATGAYPAGSGALPPHFTGVSTDTRSLGGKELFVPLSGERFDGHAFVAGALEAGAAASLWARPEVPQELLRAPLLRVGDPLEAYQQLGRFHLQRLRVPVVAVTGSTGKTTTKDLVATLLAARLRVHKTEANFNNDVGVARTLLELGPEHQAAVLELAMRGPGQIRRLARLLGARVGIITNIGISHVELLGSREAIADAKAELLDELPPEALAVLPNECDLLERLRRHAACRVLTFSADPDSRAGILPHALVNRGLQGWTVHLDGSVFEFPLPGRHHLQDLVAALAAARELGVATAEAVTGLAGFRPSGLRMEILRLADGTVLLDDSYNAAPDSVEGALEVLAGAPQRRLAVLGDMLELGAAEVEGHRRVGTAVARAGIDLLLAVGPRSLDMAEAARAGGLPRVEWVESVKEAEHLLFQEFCSGDCILFKASRGMGLDRLARALTTRSGPDVVDERT